MQETITNENHLGISIQPFSGNRLLRFIDGRLAVRIAHEKYACLPGGVSVVFQRWNFGVNSVPCCSWLHKDWIEPVWPNSYHPAIFVRSANAEEIFWLTQDDENRDRVLRLPPWLHGPSMSVGDVVAVNGGVYIASVLRCQTDGWTLLGLIDS